MSTYNPETGMFADEFYTEWVIGARQWKLAIDSETPAQKHAFYSQLDKGIAHYVRVLAESGVATCQSCEGGKGHIYPDPTVAFTGGQAEAWKAYAIAQTYGFPVMTLRQVWDIQDGVPTGPIWELVFGEKSNDFIVRRDKREQVVEDRKNWERDQ